MIYMTYLRRLSLRRRPLRGGRPLSGRLLGGVPLRPLLAGSPVASEGGGGDVGGEVALAAEDLQAVRRLEVGGAGETDAKSRRSGQLQHAQHVRAPHLLRLPTTSTPTAACHYIVTR
eukprot:277683-Prorocentrum_minimum.AAC.1